MEKSQNLSRQALSRQDYIIYGPKDLDTITCLICCDIAVDALSCAKCKAQYCVACASEWKKSHNQCPKKCSPIWNLVDAPASNAKLKCPYSEDTCEAMDPWKWQQHIRDCDHMPESQRLERDCRRNFTCRKGHKLKHWRNSYNEFVTSKCKSCSGSGCRAICSVCDEVYCVLCRPAVCSKTVCPLGHNFVYRPALKTGPSYICDVCELPPHCMGLGVNQCFKCNFGVCDRCLKRVPAELPMKIQPNPLYWRCDCGQLLAGLEEFQKGVCQECKLDDSVLTRKCKKCPDKYFCSHCKHPYLSVRNQSCRIGHHLMTVQEAKGFKDVNYKCTRCAKKPALCVDIVCKFGLCSTCSQEVTSLNNYAETEVGLVCTCGRQSIDFVLKEDQVQENETCLSPDSCSICKKQKLNCPLVCKFCNKKFCFQCMPPHYAGEDYLNHTWEPTTRKGLVCLGCEDEQMEQSLYCRLCQVAVCKTCSKLSVH